MSYTKLANKIFYQILESVPPQQHEDTGIRRSEGIIKSVDEFVSLVGQTVQHSKDFYQIADVNSLIPVEQYPGDLVWRINQGTEEISETSKKNLTIVTYSFDEAPGQVSSYKPLSADGIRNIKQRLIEVYPDPNYDGFSIARFGKDVQANVNFWVWGYRDDKGIRDRALLLRKIIMDNVWYFKHKGLKEIVWMGSNESDVWDKSNLVKSKKEMYQITFTEIQEFKEKNVEQVLVQVGIDLESTNNQ